jgi:hypothetical protein
MLPISVGISGGKSVDIADLQLQRANLHTGNIGASR